MDELEVILRYQPIHFLEQFGKYQNKPMGIGKLTTLELFTTLIEFTITDGKLIYGFFSVTIGKTNESKLEYSYIGCAPAPTLEGQVLNLQSSTRGSKFETYKKEGEPIYPSKDERKLRIKAEKISRPPYLKEILTHNLYHFPRIGQPFYPIF